MANPQKENGSTDIANELLEAIYSSGFHATQLEIILCILRYTYGFKRKEHELSVNFIAQSIKRHKVTVAQEVNEMIKSKILIQTSPPSFNSTRKISINKNYEQWVLNNTLTVSTEHTVKQKTATTVSPEANQETKNKTKNNIYYFNNIISNNIYKYIYINSNIYNIIIEWLKYKEQRKDKYTEIGLSKLLTQIENNIEIYGEEKVCDLINRCMANSYKGIIFDILKKENNNRERTIYETV